jgi:hypothetical protein
MATPVPARSEADRNLLFGILALQMDFIGRDHLIAAMHVCYAQLRQRLEQIHHRHGPLELCIRLDAAGQYADNLLLVPL